MNARELARPHHHLLPAVARVVLVFSAGAAGILAWQLLMSVAGRGNASAAALVLRELPSSVGLIAASLLVGSAVGAGAAFLAGPRVATGDGARVLGALGWLCSMPWLALPPLALCLVLFMMLRAPAVVLAVATLAGLPATTVGTACAERWARARWEAGAFAGAGAAARSVAWLAGALIPVQLALPFNGVGRLAAEAIAMSTPGAAGMVLLPLFLMALAGQGAGALLDGVSDHLDVASPAPAPVRPAGVEAAGTVAAVATLAVPAVLALVCLAALPVGAVAAASMIRGSGPHPLGIDEVGRDVLARLEVGFLAALGYALVAVVVAGVAGAVWGGIAALLRRIPGPGPMLAELVMAPAWLIVVAPLFAAGLVLTILFRIPLILVLVLLLTPRLALAVHAVGVGGPSLAIVRRGAGMLLVAMGVGVVVLVTQQAVGVLSPTPVPLGQVLMMAAETFSIGPLLLASLLVMALAAPCLTAGWALLRGPGRARVLSLLEA